MTKEQFKRAIEINNRIEALTSTRREISGTEKHRLQYMYQNCDGGYSGCPDWSMRSISEILDKHDKMIREEIDEEIRKLQEEIKEL